ncbi:MAG: cobalamin biosynthesis protein CbiD [Eubacteriaceae bacterium]|jgi:cobalt-precorrin-5B (C1)-methyltransferase|nr:cobalamin biosynthesis protein CbiD [Eubacteriaceae bacterium]
MALDKFIEKGGKKLRYGYTTGSCATAAAKGAVTSLLSGQLCSEVTIDTPKGWPLTLELIDCEFTEEWARCGVQKDAGDDPDVTDGLQIYVRAELTDQEGIQLLAGEGVGTVTLKGLSVPPGEPAINPVPREMICNEVNQVLSDYNCNKGVLLEFTIPGGAEIAKRTFNPRLGVVGGLSIIGTTGIVEPMSEQALKETMAVELSILEGKGYRDIIFVPGNYGKNFVRSLGLDTDKLVKISNYVGFMFEKSEKMSIDRILFVGHLGKMIKVAGGIFHTHSSVADGRLEIMAAHAALLGAGQKCIEQIMAATTTDDAMEAIDQEHLPGYYDHLAEVIKRKCEEKVFHHKKVEVILFSNKAGYLGQSKEAEKLKERLCIH